MCLMWFHGSPFVIVRRRGLFDQLTDGNNTNLGTLFKKYILRAGETPWPKPFHGMRASFETDLLNDGRVEPHTVARWLGHSPQIALKHYARIKDEEYEIMTDDADGGTFFTKPGRGRGRNDSINHYAKQESKGGTKSVTVTARNGLQEIATTNKKAVICRVLQSTANAYSTQNDPNGI